MLAPHIKKKVDELWNRFWAAGLTNPLVAVEQITYLLFLKRLEDIDLKRQRRGYPSFYAGSEKCKWSYIQLEKYNPKHLIEVVFPWLREIDKHFSSASAEGTILENLSNRMSDAYFHLDPNKGKVLGDAIDTIDQLFAKAGDGNAAQDIMGDTFEYLLSEVATAGKNGQFRTPRHLIRFMVELLDPKPGQRVIDPAAGTGGFLFSTQQYLIRKYSPQEEVLLEWDGTPHRATGSAATKEQDIAIHSGLNFVGLDNDRTMARIGWMNLVLHDLNDPHLIQGDSLSKREGKAQIAELLESETYDYVLANPPFTGTVDSGDLESDPVLFPRVGGGGKKKYDAITNKSELLFLWLMLDLLKVGGRGAVIIPEGVLFSNSEAHVRLRRELLTENVVEGVVSLPGGVFQPYTGVKTSIIIFRKETGRDERQGVSHMPATPLTKNVWFYEVEKDGYSENSKRTALPGQQNDLWDALEKFKEWMKKGISASNYKQNIILQPRFHVERWRHAVLNDAAGELTAAGHAFATIPEARQWNGQILAIHKLFPELPADPKLAEDQIRKNVSKRLCDLAGQYLVASALVAQGKRHITDAPQNSASLNGESAGADWQKVIKVFQQEFARAGKEVHRFFEAEDGVALYIWRDLLRDATKKGVDYLNDYLNGSAESVKPKLTMPSLNVEMEIIAREVAKLDGFDVTLRSTAVDQEAETNVAKHWVIPVRKWSLNKNWKDANGLVQGSHDEKGLVRPAYLKAVLSEDIYDESGVIRVGLLDPDCIEANGWNLSASQYKPFDYSQLKSEKNVGELINDLKATELEIIDGLEALLEMVGGKK